MKTKALIALALFVAFPAYTYCYNMKKTNGDEISVMDDSIKNNPSIALFGELAGKGFYSLNVDFPINQNHHFSFGLTALDYSFEEYENYSVSGNGALTPGVMYYCLFGSDKSYFELGAGLSLFYRLGLDYVKEDSPLSLHGVVGYRYQKQEGLIFRVGFTPFKRVNGWFLPLIGISLGYSW